jgi:hypothetical protein
MTKATNAVKPTKTSENPKGWFRPKSEIKTLDMTLEIKRGYREDREWFEKHKGA